MLVNVTIQEGNLVVSFGADSGSIPLATLQESLESLGLVKPSVDQLYQSYKEWWIEHMSVNYVGTFWGSTPEQCFATHMRNFELQEFIELLSEWGN